MDEQQERIELLVAGAALFIQNRFLEAVRNIKSSLTLDRLEELLFARRFDEALEVAEIHATNLALAVSERYILAGKKTMAEIASQLSISIRFDQTNFGAVEAMRRNQLSLISEFLESQRQATRAAMLEGIRIGLNPREQAKLFRDSIGLTKNQVQAVENYRRILEANSAASLNRALRDARFDPSVRGALQSGQVLPSGQIDRMVNAYRRRMLNFRAETIARTEALASVHEGADQAFRQAISQRILAPDDLISTWLTAEDERVRGSHSPMHEQQRPFGEPFISGSGVELRRPGDSAAPAKERIGCRCTKVTQFKIDAEGEAA